MTLHSYILPSAFLYISFAPRSGSSALLQKPYAALICRSGFALKTAGCFHKKLTPEIIFLYFSKNQLTFRSNISIVNKSVAAVTDTLIVGS